MPESKLGYFDFNGGRGEAARLALSLGGVPFEDDRVPVSNWPAHRERARFRAVPELEVAGEVFTQSNAIHRCAGKLAELKRDRSDAAVSRFLTALEQDATRFLDRPIRSLSI